MMKRKNFKWYLLSFLLLTIIFIPITFSKYTEEVNTKILLNIKSPKYTVKFNKNFILDSPDIINIPSEYQKVEYIEATGTQWIDTGVSMNGDYTLYADGYMPSGKIGVLINGQESSSLRQGMIYFTGSDKYAYYWFGKSFTENLTLASKGVSVKKRFQVTQSKTGVTFVQDGITVQDTYSGSSGTSTQNIYIFNTSANASYKNGVIYRAKILNGTTPVKDFIPCYRKADNVIGLYDLVDGTFYINNGTGIFEKGSDIISPVPISMNDQEFTYGVAQNLSKNIYQREKYNFLGWNTKADGSGTSYTDEESVLNLSGVDGAVINLYAMWKSTIPAMINGTGEDLLGKMKTFANNNTPVSNPYSIVNTNITAFVRATKDEYEAMKSNLTSDNLISAPSSAYEIYMWFDNGKIYYYTEADKLTVNGNIGKMFAKMSNLTDISGLAYFDTSNITDMNRVFQDCVSLADLTPITNWDTSKVTDMAFMFGANPPNEMSITDLTPLANWDTSKVTSFNQTFKYCTQLTNLSGIANWDVSSATTFNQMFNRSGLTDALAIVGWTPKRSADFSSMLANTSSLPNNKKPSFTSLPGTWNSNGTYIPN